jgi:hypothetical protein
MIFAKYLAVKLQTLAALYIVFAIFSAKVCSGAANILAKIQSLFHHSIHLMYGHMFIKEPDHLLSKTFY